MRSNQILINSTKKAIKKSYLIFAALVLLEVLLCIYYKGNYSNLDNTGKLAIWDYFTYLLYVRDFANETNMGSTMTLPVFYVGIAILVSLIVGLNLKTDNEEVFVVYSKSRTKWLSSKIISLFSCHITFMSIMVLIIILFGGFRFSFNRPDSLFLVKVEYNNATSMDMWIVMMIVLLTFWTIASIQILISIVAGNITGFISALIIYLVSMFMTNPVYIGNGMIINKYSFFIEHGNVKYVQMIIDVVIIFIAIIFSRIVVKKKDFL